MSDTKVIDFQADIQQLMHLIINSFYSEREVFIRELISNSADAINKYRHELLQNCDATSDGSPQINIEPDSENNTLSFTDTGIGMSESELINNLGTIAKSGTKAFLTQLENSGNGNSNDPLVGQFGVGFYSVFLVADQAVVITKRKDEQQYRWESDAGGTFTVSTDETEGLFPNGHGTRVILHINKEHANYMDSKIIEDVISRHSQFVTIPIRLKSIQQVWVEEEQPEEEHPDEASDSDEDKPKIETIEDEEEDVDQPKKVMKEIVEWNVVNTDKPIWVRPPSELTHAEYDDFYKHISGDAEGCMAHHHFCVEGKINLRGILYIPKRAPIDLYDQKKTKSDIKMYVKRILIADKADDFFPEYLGFVRGVVDSDDLEVNVSRECLQGSTTMARIKRALAKKTLEMLSNLADEDPDKYNLFFAMFGRHIKLGVHEDEELRPKLAKLLRYNSTKSEDDDNTVSLDEYCSRMKEGQTKIYYIAGGDLASVMSSPFVEKLVKRDIEVLYLTEPIDEYAIGALRTYRDHSMASVTAAGTVDFDDEHDQRQKAADAFKPLCDRVKQVVGSDISDCHISTRLETSPCCIVTPQHGWSANMERIMKAQAMRDNAMTPFMIGKRVLEINPSHPIIKSMLMRTTQTDETSVAILNIDIQTMHTIALISGGFPLANLSQVTGRLNHLLASKIASQYSPQSFSEEVEHPNSDPPIETHVGTVSETTPETQMDEQADETAPETQMDEQADGTAYEGNTFHDVPINVDIQSPPDADVCVAPSSV